MLITSESTTIIVGLDEAGRGPLAGPVVAAACVLESKRKYPVRIRDSKQMNSEQREESFEWIIARCPHGIGLVDADDIDRIGILAANERAMQMAVAEIAKIITPTFLIVDGRDKFWFDYPHAGVVDGDVTEPSISAASIIAKVTRDRLMCEHAKTFDCYGFQNHKGYGTPEHWAALEKYGMCQLHRRSFLSSLGRG